MLTRIIPLTTLVAMTFATQVLAIEACIQNPKRSQPCPHQIYKLMKLKKDQQAKVSCVCISDFAHFLVPPKNEVEKITRRMELKLLAADLQLTEQQVKNLAKR